MKIGDLVICINDTFTVEQIKIIPNRPIKDKSYIVRDIIRVFGKNDIGYLLREITNPLIVNDRNPNFSFEPNFSHSRFANLLTNNTQIETEEMELV